MTDGQHSMTLSCPLNRSPVNEQLVSLIYLVSRRRIQLDILETSELHRLPYLKVLKRILLWYSHNPLVALHG